MEPKTNPRFVGLMMAFVMPGSVHVMSGRWKTGIIWLCSLVALASLNFFVSSIPVSLSFVAFIAIQILLVSLYVIYYVSLLVSSYRLTTPRLGYCGWFLFLLAVLTFYTVANDFLSLMFRTYIGRHDNVVGLHMYPTLKAEDSGTSHWGDKTMLSTLSYQFGDPCRGDIVGFKMREQQWWQQPQHVSRRVVGLPGETVDICPPYVLINGEKLLDPPIFSQISSCEDGYSGYVTGEDSVYVTAKGIEIEGIALPITLGPDEYFVLGDHSVKSFDSRHCGPVSREAIVGKVVRIVFPPWRIREL
jgi:signal peptidase I